MPRPFSAAFAFVLATAALAAQQQPARPAATPPAAAQPSEPQGPPVTFRTEVDFVEVDAVVRDAKGNFVRDLKPEEFQVLEDGVPQAVTAFSLVDIPIVKADRPLFVPRERAIEPDVRSNTGGPSGRVYVLLLDDLHTAFDRSVRVRQMARQFIERNLGDNDVVAVIHASGRSDAGQDFTNNRRLLLQAVDKFMGRKLRSAFLNKLDVYNRNRTLGDTSTVADADDAERLQQARNILETLRNVSDWLANVHGRRKTVILIGEGIDYAIGGPGSSPEATDASSANSSTSTDSGSASSSQSPSTMPFQMAENRGDGAMLAADSRDVIASALRANVNIYAVDPRGLATASEDLITVSGSLPNDQSLGLTSTALADELERGQDSLRVLSEQTGGFASVASNDFGSAFQRIVDENSSYYMLGYHPKSDKRDTRFHKLEVRVTRPGGLEVKARKGYARPAIKPSKEKDRKVEASAGTSNELRAVLDSPLPTPDLRFSVFAAPVKGPGKKAAIAIVSEFDGRDFAFQQSGSRRTNTLEFSCVAVNTDGKVAGGNRESIDLTVKPDTYQRILASGFRVQSRLELAPGSYQLRVGAREAGGKAGSVYYDLVVPDFGQKDLGVSGLMVTSKAAGAVPTAGGIAELANILPTPPTTTRTFHAGDELGVFAEIYDNEAKHAHSVYVTTRLQAEGNTPVYSNTETRSSQELGGGKGGYGHTAKIPLANLAPGLYVLRVEARSSLKGVAPVAREVQIEIVP